MNLFIIVLFIAGAGILAWNFIPAIRERLRGLTTVLDGAVVVAMPLIGEAIDVFQSTSWREIIPSQYWPWVLSALGLWMIYKRIKTHTPVGEAE